MVVGNSWATRPPTQVVANVEPSCAAYTDVYLVDSLAAAAPLVTSPCAASP